MNTLTYNENRFFNACMNWKKNNQYGESDDTDALLDIIQEKLWEVSNRIMESGSPQQIKQMVDWAANYDKKWNAKDEKWDDTDEDDKESCDGMNDNGVMCHYSKTTGRWEQIEESCPLCDQLPSECQCENTICKDCGKDKEHPDFNLECKCCGCCDGPHLAEEEKCKKCEKKIEWGDEICEDCETDDLMCECGKMNYEDRNNITVCQNCDAKLCQDCEWEGGMCDACLKEKDEEEAEWCSPECEEEEGCIKCNPFAYQSEEQMKKWEEEKEKEAAQKRVFH